MSDDNKIAKLVPPKSYDKIKFTDSGSMKIEHWCPKSNSRSTRMIRLTEISDICAVFQDNLYEQQFPLQVEYVQFGLIEIVMGDKRKFFYAFGRTHDENRGHTKEDYEAFLRALWHGFDCVQSAAEEWVEYE